MAETKQRTNYDAYVHQFKDQYEAEHAGRIVLMHDCDVFMVFNDLEDAYKVGVKNFGLGDFLLVEVGAKPAELGAVALTFA